jgi:hypothetical protein
LLQVWPTPSICSVALRLSKASMIPPTNS